MSDYFGGEKTEEEWRQVMRDDHGCDCSCSRVWDYDRIVAAGGNPGDPGCIVFVHSYTCHYVRVRMASTN